MHGGWREEEMSVAARTTRKPIADANPPPPRAIYRFSVEQYDRLIETGILTDNDRVELLHGWVVEKMPQNPPHNITITRVNRRLLRVLPAEWLLQVQGAIVLRDSEPEPDFAILRGPEEAYFDRKPAPRDIALLIEVADSTLLQDRLHKALLYAQARIPQYWIINLGAARVEVYTQPRVGKSAGYRQQRDYGINDTVPLILAGHEIARIPVRELVPSERTKTGAS
jgi:Uma2 family endonuclease